MTAKPISLPRLVRDAAHDDLGPREPTSARRGSTTKAPSKPQAPLPPGLENALVGFDEIDDVASEAIEWAWEGIYAVDHGIECAGASYSGKTTLGFLLAAAHAHVGEPVEVLGRRVTPVPEGKSVVIVEEENSQRSCRDKLIASCEMLGIEPRAALDRIVLIARCGMQVGDPQWRALLALAAADRIGFTLIDSRARVFNGGSANAEEDQCTRDVLQLMNHSGGPVFIVSHTRKPSGMRSGGARRLALEDVSGSHQRAAWADVVLLVSAERDEADRVLSSTVRVGKLRDAVDDHPEPVTFSIAKDQQGRWRCAVNASAREADQPVHERVFELLRREGEKTKTELRTALSTSGATIERALSVLFKERRVRKREALASGKRVSKFAARIEAARGFDDLRPTRARDEEDDDG